ncbi:hypothetical protein Tco_0966916 [Tanacetum coccineum]
MLRRGDKGIRDVGYGIRILGNPAEAVPEIAPMTVREVNTRVVGLAELHERNTQDLYALLEDAHDGTPDTATAAEYSIQPQHQGTRDLSFIMQQMSRMPVLRETDRRRQDQMVETLRVIRDMRREMSDMHAELLACESSGICQPLNFKGAEGVVGLTRWIEKMESVFHISGCAVENQVKFATCTLLGAALTWWNGQIRTLGPEAYAMTWDVAQAKDDKQVLSARRDQEARD